MDHLQTTLLACALLCVISLLGHAALLARARADRSPAPLLHPILAVELLGGEAARAYLRSAVLDLEIERRPLSGASVRQASRLARRSRQALLRDASCAPTVHDRLDRAEALLDRGDAGSDTWRALADSLPEIT